MGHRSEPQRPLRTRLLPVGVAPPAAALQELGRHVHQRARQAHGLLVRGPRRAAGAGAAAAAGLAEAAGKAKIDELGVAALVKNHIFYLQRRPLATNKKPGAQGGGGGGGRGMGWCVVKMRKGGCRGERKWGV